MNHPEMARAASWDLRLVALSYMVAVFASYTALDFAGKVATTRGRAHIAWLAGGAFAGLGRDSKDEGIVRAMIELSRTLGLEVIAEGVESGEQLTHLREAGCVLAQGFYFWPPLPTEKVDELLVTYNYS
jgi:hypothetical protein